MVLHASYVSQLRGLLMGFIKVIREVRKRRHPIPLFGHIVDETSKNREKKVLIGLQWGVSLPGPFFS
jgi:hypothetical protein